VSVFRRIKRTTYQCGALLCWKMLFSRLAYYLARLSLAVQSAHSALGHWWLLQQQHQQQC